MKEEMKHLKICAVTCTGVGLFSLVIFIPVVGDFIIDLIIAVKQDLSHDYWYLHDYWYKKLLSFERIFFFIDFIALTVAYSDRLKKLKNIIIPKYLILKEYVTIPDFKKWFGISAIIFLIAHGYRFFNALYNHDSLRIFLDYDYSKIIISSGRFLRPIYTDMFRGRIAAPLLIGCISFIFLMVSAYLILNLLNIRSIKKQCMATAMLTTSVSIILLNATYIYDVDPYMLALLLSVCGAYIAIKHSRYFIVSVACMALSMGLYQSYIQVAVILLMFDVFSDVLKNKDAKDIVRKCAVYLCTLVVAFVVYWCLVKLFLYIYQVPMNKGYNGMSDVGHYESFSQLLSCFSGSYKYVFRSFVNPITAHKIYSLIARFMLLFTGTWAIGYVLIKGKLSKINILFTVVLICLFPFGVNFVYFITQGMEHDLMTFSFAVVPLLIFPLLSKTDAVNGKSLPLVKIMVYISFVVIIFSNIIFANQVYIKKDLEAKSTLSIMTRIIDRIEQTEGYVAGKTEVCIIGELYTNQLVIARRKGFKYNGTGNWTLLSVTHNYNIEYYISHYLAYPYKKYWDKCPSAIADSLDVFPAKNCTTVQDGVLYIKIGNNE